MDFEEFDFKLDKIESYIDGLKDITEILEYLHWVKYKCSSIMKDFECGVYKIESLINFYESKKMLTDILPDTQNNEQTFNEVNHEKIIWYGSKNQLLYLFKLLEKDQLIPEYKQNEVLTHFFLIRDENIKQSELSLPVKKIMWLGSDNDFVCLLDELIKQKLIRDFRKYKQFNGHFVNRENKSFKYLSQKKNFVMNFLDKQEIITKIINQINREL